MKRPEKPHRKRDQSVGAIMLWWLGLLGCAHFTLCFAADPITLDPKAYHLGIEGLPEWRPFDGKKPHARELHLKLPGLQPVGPSTLTLRQKVVACLAHTVGADGEVTLQEAELLRAFADALGCPIPPFVSGPEKPSNT